MNNTTVTRDKATVNRQAKATEAFLVRVHRLWHQIRNIEVCPTLKCEHPWAP